MNEWMEYAKLAVVITVAMIGSGGVGAYLTTRIQLNAQAPKTAAEAEHLHAQAAKAMEEASAQRIENAVDRLDLIGRMQERLDNLEMKLAQAEQDKRETRNREILLQAKVDEQTKRIGELQDELSEFKSRLRHCEDRWNMITSAVRTTAKDLEVEDIAG